MKVNILFTHVDPSQVPEYGARAVQFLRALHPTPITPVFLAGSLAVTISGVFRLYCSLALMNHCHLCKQRLVDEKAWGFTGACRKSVSRFQLLLAHSNGYGCHPTSFYENKMP
jgi:hypothetical protein